MKPYGQFLIPVSDDVAGSDMTRNFLQTAEEEDDVTEFTNGDMGLQACALYDYQAGKLSKPCTISAVFYDSFYTSYNHVHRVLEKLIITQEIPCILLNRKACYHFQKIPPLALSSSS